MGSEFPLCHGGCGINPPCQNVTSKLARGIQNFCEGRYPHILPFSEEKWSIHAHFQAHKVILSWWYIFVTRLHGEIMRKITGKNETPFLGG